MITKSVFTAPSIETDIALSLSPRCFFYGQGGHTITQGSGAVPLSSRAATNPISLKGRMPACPPFFNIVPRATKVQPGNVPIAGEA